MKFKLILIIFTGILVVSWYDEEPEGWVNCIIRHQNPPNDRYEDVGFRCLLPADKLKSENIK